MACNRGVSTRGWQVLFKNQTSCDYEEPTIADYVPLDFGFTMAPTPSTEERNVAKIGFSKEAPVTTYVELEGGSFQSEMLGYGAAYTGTELPIVDALLLNAGMEKTFDTDHWDYTFDSTGSPLASVRVCQDDKLVTKFEAAKFSEFSITGNANGIMRCGGTFLGKPYFDGGVAQILRDGNNVAGTLPTYATKPAIMQGNQILSIGSTAWYPTFSGEVSLNFGNAVSLIENGNADAGIENHRLTDRNPVLSINVLLVTPSEKDLIQNWLNNVTEPISFTYGTETGNTWTFTIPAATLNSMTLSDQDNLSYAQLSYTLTGNDDNELTITAS